MRVSDAWRGAKGSAPAEHRLMLFFGLAYFVHGIAGGVAKQPVTYYFKSLGMAPDAVAACFAVAAIPWMIKPLYGLIIDCVPLWGYRRKSYLLVMAACAAAGYAWLTALVSADLIMWGLFIGTLGIAAIDVIVDALMVEEGLARGLVRRFQSQQWTWLNVAAITAGWVGGWLSHARSPEAAIQAAAVIMVAAPMAIVVATWLWIDEPRQSFAPLHTQRTGRHVFSILKSKAFWTVGAFLACWNVIPNFSTPMYFHMIDRLNFDQYAVGQLAAIGSVGATIGAVAYRSVMDRWSATQAVLLAILLSTLMALAYLLVHDGVTAAVVSFLSGIVSMLTLLTFFSLAASVCPSRAAAFAFATLMSLYSATTHIGAMLGGYLYQSVFHQDMAPLIYAAALCTAGTLVWLPFLPADTADDRPVSSVPAEAHARPAVVP